MRVIEARHLKENIHKTSRRKARAREAQKRIEANPSMPHYLPVLDLKLLIFMLFLGDQGGRFHNDLELKKENRNKQQLPEVRADLLDRRRAPPAAPLTPPPARSARQRGGSSAVPRNPRGPPKVYAYGVFSSPIHGGGGCG